MSPSPWRRALTPVVAAATLAGTLLYAVVQSGPAIASTTDAAFNSEHRHAERELRRVPVQARHRLQHARTPNPLYGLTVGNGKTGAMVWNANQLTMQVSGVDLSQQSAFAAGNVNLTTTPAMDTGYTTFQQRLSLYDGTLTTKYDTNRTVTDHGLAQLRGHGHPRRRHPHRASRTSRSS